MGRTVQKESALAYILESLLPYTDANLKLTFKPAVFYKELSEKSGKSESSLKNALVKAKKENLIQQSGGNFAFNKQATELLKRFKKLDAMPLKSGYMLVMFDVPQSHDTQRRYLVRELKRIGFTQIQKSVWSSQKDCRDLVLDIISELQIGRYVAISLTHPVFGSHHFEK